MTVHGPAGRRVPAPGRVVVDREDLTTAYDRLVVVVVRLGSRRVAAFFSDVPTTAQDGLLRAVVVSRSITPRAPGA